MVRSFPDGDGRRSGAPLLVLSSLLFGVMALLTKRAASLVPGPEVALVRFLVGLAAVLIYQLSGRTLRPVNWLALFLRGLFGGLAVLGFFISIWKLPVGLATLLNYTSPVVTAVLASLFLEERLRPATVAALAVTMAGVVMVVHAHAPVGRFGFGPWEMLGVGSAVFSGAAVTAIRWSRRTDGHWEIFGAFCLVGSLVCLPLSWTGWVRPTAEAWAFMMAVGVLSVVAQLLFIYALRYTSAATSGVISQLTPISTLILGAVFLGERATLLSAVGAAITLGGVVWGARVEEAGSRVGIRRT